MKIVTADILGNALASGERAVANYGRDLGRLSGGDQRRYRTVRNSQDHDGFVVSTRPYIPKPAEDIALVILLNVKSVVTHKAFFNANSNVLEEVRDMTRLYLQSRLGRAHSPLRVSHKNRK